MLVTVRQLLQLHSLQCFKLVAGGNGLNNPVASAGVWDYEYSDDVAYSRKEIFTPKSFIITSLLIAKGHEEKILGVLQRLIEDGASTLAYKSIVYQDLPEEVLAYADAHSFPIFCFDDTVYYENIIYEIIARVLLEGNMLIMEKNIENMIFRNLERDEISIISKGIFDTPAQNCLAVYIQSTEDTVLSIGSILNNYNRTSINKEKSTIYKYHDSTVVLITLNYSDFRRFEIVFDEVMRHCKLEKTK